MFQLLNFLSRNISPEQGYVAVISETKSDLAVPLLSQQMLYYKSLWIHAVASESQQTPTHNMATKTLFRKILLPAAQLTPLPALTRSTSTSSSLGQVRPAYKEREREERLIDKDLHKADVLRYE